MATFHISHKSKSDRVKPHPWADWAGHGKWTVDLDDVRDFKLLCGSTNEMRLSFHDDEWFIEIDDMEEALV